MVFSRVAVLVEAIVLNVIFVADIIGDNALVVCHVAFIVDSRDTWRKFVQPWHWAIIVCQIKMFATFRVAIVSFEDMIHIF